MKDCALKRKWRVWLQKNRVNRADKDKAVSRFQTRDAKRGVPAGILHLGSRATGPRICISVAFLCSLISNCDVAFPFLMNVDDTSGQCKQYLWFVIKRYHRHIHITLAMPQVSHSIVYTLHVFDMMGGVGVTTRSCYWPHYKRNTYTVASQACLSNTVTLHSNIHVLLLI